MENERLGLTYDKLTRLAVALDVDMSTLFTDAAQLDEPSAAGRRSLTRKGSGKKVLTGNYAYTYLSPELSHKQMVPIVVTVRATSLQDFGPLIRHGGEEWIYVIKGEIEVYTEFYEPERLRAGDSIYIDSRMGHAYIRKGNVPAELVCVCSAPEAELLESADSQVEPARSRPPAARKSRK